MLDDFIKYIEERNICKIDEMILLAVSGGIDSMVLTHLFQRAGFKTGIAHCNFSLRGEESDLDEELVRDTASGYGVSFYNIKFETKEHAKKLGISIQMAARELRYQWFEKIRSENNFDSVAVAHNLNDNIETLLINLIRGTGITGLTGMKPVSSRIIRPLLFASRERIREYRDQFDIPFREDKSNSDTKYTRNKIRHLILPVLKEINPALESTLTETAERLSGIYEIVTDQVQKITARSSYQDGMRLKYNIKNLKPCLQNKALVFELFKVFGITGSNVTDLINVIEGRSGGKIITPTHKLIKNRGDLCIIPKEETDEIYCEINNTEELKRAPGIFSVEVSKVGDDFRITKDNSFAFLDLAKISFPMVIRRWHNGDYFVPFGMHNKKKLSDYFIDNKYALNEKEETLILESAGAIVWIVGERIDDRFKVTSATTEVLVIESYGKHIIQKRNV